MSATGSEQPADLIFRGGPIYTVNRDRPWVEALAVRDGKIVAAGADDRAAQLRGRNTEIVDLGGRMAMPGLLDVHNHHLRAGRGALFEMTFLPNLGFEEILDLVRERAAKAAPRAWIIGGIWPSHILGRLNSLKARRALDEASAGHPVMLRDDTQHNRWVNSRALEIAGITSQTRDPFNGVIVKDPHSQEPIGLLYEAASGLVERAAMADEPGSAESDVTACSWAVKKLNAYGITAFQDAAAPLSVLAALKALDDRGGLTAWAVASMPALEMSFMAGMAGEALFDQADRYRTDRVRPDYVKIMLDGVPTARTAAMLEPYRPDTAYGCCFRGGTAMSLPDLARWIGIAEKRGLAVKIHCAGDGAVRQALDAIDVVRSFNGPTTLRHHIAHASFIDPLDISRFKELGVVADLSPIIWFPSVIVEAIRMAVPEERAMHFWPNRDLLEAGALMAAGSDWPVVPEPDPWWGMEGMVTRKNPRGEVGGALWPEQAIDVETAVEVYTLNAARAMGLEEVTGSLEVGKSADLIVLERNLFETPPDEIADMLVETTYFAGRPVFQRI